MAWRDWSWRGSLFGWLGESTGQALVISERHLQLSSPWPTQWKQPTTPTATTSQNLRFSSRLRFFEVPQDALGFFKRSVLIWVFEFNYEPLVTVQFNWSLVTGFFKILRGLLRRTKSKSEKLSSTKSLKLKKGILSILYAGFEGC